MKGSFASVFDCHQVSDDFKWRNDEDGRLGTRLNGMGSGVAGLGVSKRSDLFREEKKHGRDCVSLCGFNQFVFVLSEPNERQEVVQHQPVDDKMALINRPALFVNKID